MENLNTVIKVSMDRGKLGYVSEYPSLPLSNLNDPSAANNITENSIIKSK